jgi:uncharacterized protein (DUF4415 family)
MSSKSTSSNSQTDWQRLDAMTDDDIDLSDCPEITSDLFSKAVVRRGVEDRSMKVPVTVYLDRDLLEWLESRGQRSEQRINQLLRECMESQS